MNESLKKAQATYQEKCKIINLRVNKESEKEIIEWLEFQKRESYIALAIKKLIYEDYKRLIEHKTRVIYYSAEVKYSGSLEDYTPELLLKMAEAQKIDKGFDAYDYIIITNEIEARKLDGQIIIDDRYPSNNLCIVRWVNIDESYWEEQEEE